MDPLIIRLVYAQGESIATIRGNVKAAFTFAGTCVIGRTGVQSYEDVTL